MICGEHAIPLDLSKIVVEGRHNPIGVSCHGQDRRISEGSVLVLFDYERFPAKPSAPLTFA